MVGMNILIVASYNNGRFAPFILEQAETLKRTGCEVDLFGLQGLPFLHLLAICKRFPPLQGYYSIAAASHFGGCAC